MRRKKTKFFDIETIAALLVAVTLGLAGFLFQYTQVGGF